jgi:hypothetical protein
VASPNVTNVNPAPGAVGIVLGLPLSVTFDGLHQVPSSGRTKHKLTRAGGAGIYSWAEKGWLEARE